MASRPTPSPARDTRTTLDMAPWMRIATAYLLEDLTHPAKVMARSNSQIAKYFDLMRDDFETEVRN